MEEIPLRIGISTRLIKNETYPEKRDAISHDWINFFNELNFIPILIPNTLENIGKFLEQMQLDGIILSGGDNIGDFPERDNTETQIIEYSIKKLIPLFGVCRGMQVINHYFGGSIAKNATSQHTGNYHDISLNEENFSIIGKNSIKVNSYHNNLINNKDLANYLECVAIAYSDNSVEAFTHKKYPILAVMWHPERKPDENSKNILRNFFNLNK